MFVAYKACAIRVCLLRLHPMEYFLKMVDNLYNINCCLNANRKVLYHLYLLWIVRLRILFRLISFRKGRRGLNEAPLLLAQIKFGVYLTEYSYFQPSKEEEFAVLAR